MKTYPIATPVLALLLSGTALFAQSDQEHADQAPASSQAVPDAGGSPKPASTSPHSASMLSSSAGVRIVRLSQIKGDVQMDRGVDRGYEAAFANLPIIQGCKLKTTDGVAEVEFEDNTSLRLTPGTTVEFAQLRRDPSGATTTTVHVVQGTVYASMASTRGNRFTLTSGEGELVLEPGSRLHFHEGSPKTVLAVLDGTVEAHTGSSTVTVPKKKTLVFDPATPNAPVLVSHLDKDPYDAWDKEAVQYHQRYMNTSSFGSSYGTGSPLYGLNDMNYYGSFVDMGGSCGNLWRPYLASAAWDPYANGMLAYYPNSGYSWVSPYPWGWTAYHSGNWQNCGNAGWGWQPGSSFVGLGNLDSAALKKHVPRPPIAPGPGRPSILAINHQPLAISGLTNANSFVFNKDSAGLGVPRETFGKLNRISTGAIQHGSVSAPAYIAPVTASRAGGPSLVTAHAGYSPASIAGASSRGGYSPASGASNVASAPSSVPSSAVSHAGGSMGGGAPAGGGTHK